MAALPRWCRTVSVAASFGVLTPQEWEVIVEEEEQRKCVWRSAFGGHTAFVVWAVFGALRGHDGSCAIIRQAVNAATAGRRESLADFLRSAGEEYSSITAEQVIAALLAGWDDRAAFLRNELFAARTGRQVDGMYGHLACYSLPALHRLIAMDPTYGIHDTIECAFVARKGTLAGLQALRAMQIPAPWDSSVCDAAASAGVMGPTILKWITSQDPCLWDVYLSAFRY